MDICEIFHITRASNRCLPGASCVPGATGSTWVPQGTNAKVPVLVGLTSHKPIKTRNKHLPCRARKTLVSSWKMKTGRVGQMNKVKALDEAVSLQHSTEGENLR